MANRIEMSIIKENRLSNVLAVLPSYTPSTVINVQTPLRYLHEHGQINAVIRLENEVTPTEVAAADVMVLCRNTEPIYKPIYDLALRLGVPMIYDLDDNVLAAPKGSASDHYHNHPTRKAQFEWMLHNAALVRVHSPALLEVVHAYNTNVHLVWAAVDWSLVPAQLPTLSQSPIEIVYAAQKETGQKLFPFILPDLQQALSRYGDRIRLNFLGFNPAELRGNANVVLQPFESDYAAYFSKFTSYGYAIGLAPMLDDLFHQSKTNIKFRDYGAAGIAGIYTDCSLYRGSVTDGETGLLVSGGPGSWLPALEKLIENPMLVESLRQKARRFVQDRYNMQTVGAMWVADLQSVQPSASARPPISAETQAEIATTKWPFTGQRKPDAPAVARLRRVLRDVVPMRWKLMYYDVQYSLRSRRMRR